MTAVAAEAWKSRKPIHVLTDRPEVWESNPHIVSVEVGIGRWFEGYKRGRISTEIRHLTCSNHSKVHLAQQMAANINLSLAPGWRPVFKPRQRCKIDPKTIVIQNSCRGAKYAADTKEWPFERWNEIVSLLLKDGYSIIQIGTQFDPVVTGAIDLRGKTSLPMAAFLLEKAKLFIGLESGLMHLAAAVGSPSVILYGGRTKPEVTGYPHHQQIVELLMDCVGCGLNIGCPHEVACMKHITVEEVWKRVHEELEKSQLLLGETTKTILGDD